jgi:hypothetical protein
MADILFDLPINVPVERVFRAISEPEGLDTWWTEACTGAPELGAIYTLGFGPSFASARLFSTA